MVEIIWKEPPPAVSSEKAAIFAELQKNPGRWALVQPGYKSTSATAPWKKLGCEATYRRAETAEGTTTAYDIYARWPEPKAGKTALADEKAAVAKAVASGTALKPPTPAAPKAKRPDEDPDEEATGGYSKFLASQRAGTNR